MIYAIIIIVALAIAFIIIIRRLPKAFEEASQAPTKGSVVQSPARTNLRWPKLALPKLTVPRFKLPTFKLSLSKLPTIKWPQLPNRPVAAPAESTAQTVDKAKPTHKDDFWDGVITAPAQVEPTTLPASPINNSGREKTRVRNLWQEAEDAFAIKDYRKAERLYLRLATEDPRNAKTYGRLGVIYLEQHNYDDARDALQAAIKLEPSVASRHFNLALAYLNLGSKAKAISSMETTLKYDPSNRKYRKMLDDILTGRA